MDNVQQLTSDSIGEHLIYPAAHFSIRYYLNQDLRWEFFFPFAQLEPSVVFQRN
jgi:hypothetical protein